MHKLLTKQFRFNIQGGYKVLGNLNRKSQHLNTSQIKLVVYQNVALSLIFSRVSLEKKISEQFSSYKVKTEK
jgi:hypothetical protein